MGSATPVRHRAGRSDDIDRRRRPRLIRPRRLRQAGKVEARLRADRRGACAAFDGKLKGQPFLRIDAQYRVRQIGGERDAEPLVQTIEVDAPARGGVADRRFGQAETRAPRAHLACLAVDRQAAPLVEHPAGCAAQFPVDAHREVEREHDVPQVDANPLRRPIAAHAVAEPILARAHIEQPAVVLVRRPAVARNRKRCFFNSLRDSGEHRPRQRQRGKQRRPPSAKRRADHRRSRVGPPLSLHFTTRSASSIVSAPISRSSE